MGDGMVLVVGAGPGVSGSLARLYAREGWDVGLVGLDAEVLTRLSRELRDLGGTALWKEADVTDDDQLRMAVMRLAEQVGRVDVLHFNPSAFRAKNALELTADELLADVRVGVGGLLTALQAARGFLERGARITATGSSAADRPSPGACSLGVQKAGLRNLVRSIDRLLAEDGIRAVSVTVDGVLAPDDPDSPFHPDRVAATIRAAAAQPEEGWRDEVVHAK